MNRQHEIKITLIIAVLGGMLLAGCERREKGEPQREPGNFFSLGTPACSGDVCH